MFNKLFLIYEESVREEPFNAWLEDFPRYFASSNQLKLDKSTEREREIYKQKNSQFYSIKFFPISFKTRNIGRSSSVIQMKLIDPIILWIIWMTIEQISGREFISLSSTHCTFVNQCIVFLMKIH